MSDIKPKTYEVPMKAQWERKEYLKSKKALDDYKKVNHIAIIFCSFCRKKIDDIQINVVNFGDQIACRTCYSKKWAKLKNRIAVRQFPSDLQDVVQEPESEELIAQKASDTAKALALANAECERIKKSPLTEK